jgi:hypothetical protein
MSKRVLLACAFASDGRIVAYLQGAAFGMAANCPNLPLDVKAITLAKRGIEGIRQGNAADFAAGGGQFHNLLNGESDRRMWGRRTVYL